MSSVNLKDFLYEQLCYLSSKMKDDSFSYHGTSSLVNGGCKNFLQQWDPLKAIIGLKENSVSGFKVANPYYPNVLNEILDMLESDHLKFHDCLERPEHFSQVKNGLSPHLFNLISNLNSYRYRYARSDMMSLLLSSSIFFENMKNSVFSKPLKMINSNPDSDMKKTCSPPVNQYTMSVNVSHLPPKTVDSTKEKCNLSTDVKLSLTLANRKTKQMNKRSKKRRRRQKKFQQSNVGNPVTSSGNRADNKYQSPVSSRVCVIAESPDFGCKVSFQHIIQKPSSVSSFLVPVESDSDDDSEWESYDETNNNSSSSTSDSEVDCAISPSSNSSLVKSESTESICSTSEDYTDSEVDCEISQSSNSSPVKSENTESRCSTPEDYVTSAPSIVSFVVPGEDSGDDWGSSDDWDSSDDSDWDSSEQDTFIETAEFEFTGLFLANFHTPQTPKTDNKLTVVSEDETEECLQLKRILLEVNKTWDALTEGDKRKKSASKVTFAPDDSLVETFPVEMYERKGEWEIYATERLRFKRRIEELEKVIAPCLHPDHRTKVFKKIMVSEL